MPQIIKPKSAKKSTVKKKRTVAKKSLVPVKTRSKSTFKHSAPDYYQCLLNYANQDWHHPVTGEKKKITACCKDCKLSAPSLTKQRKDELTKLITSYKQVGDSLAKLLQPIK